MWIFFLFLFVSDVSSTKCNRKNVDFVCPNSNGCVNETCTVCTSDEHCSLQSYCLKGQCTHRTLFPMSGYSVLTIFALFFVSILGGATGLGGGSFAVPVLALCSAFSSVQAVAISQATILGNGIISFFAGAISRHPTRNRPRIAFDVVFVLFPSLLCGSFIGVFVAPLLPQWVIMILMVLFLISTISSTIKRAVKELRQERMFRKKNSSGNLGDVSKSTHEMVPFDDKKRPISMAVSSNQIDCKSTDLNEHKISSINNEEEIGADNAVLHSVKDIVNEEEETKESEQHQKNKDCSKGMQENETSSPETDEGSLKKATPKKDRDALELERILKKEQHFPVIKLLFCFGNWCLLVFVSFVRGGKGGAKSLFGVEKCSMIDWLSFGLFIFVSILLALFAGLVLMQEERKKKRLNYPFAIGDVHWKPKTAVLLPIACIAAGFIAGLLGIGGALVTSPVLLEMGILVPVVTATTSALLLATSASATAQFAVSSLLPIDFGVFFFAIGVAGALIGLLVISRLAVKYHRYSILLFSILVLYCVSLIMSGFYGIYSVVLIFTNGGAIGFKSPCA
ncbi:putative sulfite exporter TauE [Monocercomonoides exilis]|uniref:putative sulfite exporter TauE n=1 Tax=Monocercomonoides exilis TaxID=2049356 RepID=UPI0035595C83|nr:putative sulfite exporter TauE [Monocercomonoides exilis]|eukprot:MONOS_6597.1-p1 / transcript=MONOS_6597.1 / gene=MONOS_6597 / organism=Monocercomonoides_exilis_PA203 / gene_product=sulfite exporter TauE / transcript_product=sulfite exporter TauE / location=Mono_scaffold00210:63620-65403(+) / protein_length=565 / sequence_SO=supercontig / SO=protein_coding / is_pseudo=false